MTNAKASSQAGGFFMQFPQRHPVPAALGKGKPHCLHTGSEIYVIFVRQLPHIPSFLPFVGEPQHLHLSGAINSIRDSANPLIIL